MIDKNDEYDEKEFNPFNWEFEGIFDDMDEQFRKMRKFMNTNRIRL